jgi:hypothetical protein
MTEDARRRIGRRPGRRCSREAGRRHVGVARLPALRARQRVRPGVPTVRTRQLLIAGLLLLGCAATLAIQSWSTLGALSGHGRSATATASAESQVVMVPAVEQYLAGLTGFDARLMWDALSPGAIRTMQARGASLEALQREMDAARARGVRYEGSTRDVAYHLQSGEAYLFYTLSRRGHAGPDRLDQIKLVFVLDPDGRIGEVSSSRSAGTPLDAAEALGAPHTV